MQFEFLSTDRLHLRKIEDEAYEDLLRQASDEELIELFGFGPDDLVRERDRAIKGFATFNKTLLIFHLIEKHTNQVIGWCGYHTWYRNHDRAEIGYALNDENHFGKGYMSEALECILRYGFEQMNLHRIEAMVGPDNLASLQLMKKFGFKKEGVLRSHYFVDGKFDDSVVFGLLKNESRYANE